MPSIEITAEQAQALARGENITIQSPKATYQLAILVPSSGSQGASVRLVRTRGGVVEHRLIVYSDTDKQVAERGWNNWPIKDRVTYIDLPGDRKYS